MDINRAVRETPYNAWGRKEMREQRQREDPEKQEAMLDQIRAAETLLNNAYALTDEMDENLRTNLGWALNYTKLAGGVLEED